MEFPVEQALSLLTTLVVTLLLLVGIGTALSAISNSSEKSTVTDSQLPKQDINQTILGSNAPTLTIKPSIKITTNQFSSCNNIDDVLAIIKVNSNCYAKDYQGNNIDSNNIILSFDRDDDITIWDYVRKGGVVRVKYYVEDSLGRKTSVIKNIIFQKPGGGVDQ